MDITTLSSRRPNDASTEPVTNSMKHPDLETSSDAPVPTYSSLLKPIVIPRTGSYFPITVACADEVLAETSNLFSIKSLSPFPTWAYSQQLEHQKISQAEFERFVADVNSALVSNPVLQLTFVVGGFSWALKAYSPSRLSEEAYKSCRQASQPVYLGTV